MRYLAAFLFALAALTAPVRAETPVTVFAAASLRGALDVVAQSFGGAVRLSYGGSGTMARQIAAGAPADVAILASAEWIDWLAQNAPLLDGSRRIIATNELVLIGAADSAATDFDLVTLLGADGRLAMGQRDAVPAGIYAREWLQNTGQWDSVLHRLAETDNVRAALALVARGEAPVGIVYASDAVAESGVRILLRIPPETHSPIVYPAAALTPAGQMFLDHLVTPAAQDIFASFGFGAVPE